MDKWYYGVRFARNCSTDDLWKTYFTSSRHVKEFREQYGEPDIIKIRQTFDDTYQAREWEHKVLRRLKVQDSEKWLNKSTGKSIPPLSGSDHPMFEKTHSAETREKMSLAHKGKIFSDETKEKLSRANKGKIFSDEHREKLSESKKGERHHQYGKPHSDATKQKMSLAKKGKTRSDATKQKMALAKRGTMNVFDIEENEIVRIQKELYHQNRERYLNTNSKAYKKIKEGEK